MTDDKNKNQPKPQEPKDDKLPNFPGKLHEHREQPFEKGDKGGGGGGGLEDYDRKHIPSKPNDTKDTNKE